MVTVTMLPSGRTPGCLSHLQRGAVGQSSSLSSQLRHHDVAAPTQLLWLLPLLLLVPLPLPVLLLLPELPSWQGAFGVGSGRRARLVVIVVSCSVVRRRPSIAGVQQELRSFSSHHLQQTQDLRFRSSRSAVTVNGTWFHQKQETGRNKRNHGNYFPFLVSRQEC